MYFFTGDEHYYHNNIIEYCGRPFESVEDMNDALVDRHNARVRADDVVVHCGDFSFYNWQYARLLWERLNGTHIFIRGNHDQKRPPDGNKYHDIWEKRVNGTLIVACHYPMVTWRKKNHGAIHVFAHMHGAYWPDERTSVDVGVDSWGYAPVSFDELTTYVETGERRAYVL